MPRINIEKVNEPNPDFNFIRSASNDFKDPVIIKGVLTDSACYKKWNKIFFKEKFNEDELIQGKLHSASYWSDNPLMREYSSMTSQIRPSYFFEESISSNGNEKSNYYISRFKRYENEYLPVRRIPFNKLDKVLLEDLPSPNYTYKSNLTLIWLSNGNTKSLLHSDPMHNAFLQIVGKKRLFLVSDRQKLSKFRNILTPHLLSIKRPYSKNYNVNKEISDFDYYDFHLEPGELLIIPAWCYHHVLSEESGLNISLTNHFIPTISFKLNSKTSMLAWFSRKIYPMLVKKKRILHMAKNITPTAIPFFPREVQYLKQAAKVPSWDHDAEYYLINESTKEQTFIIDPNTVNILLSIDGKKSISDIANSERSPLSHTVSIIRDLIVLGYIGIYYTDGDNFLNYYNHLSEAY